MRDLEVPFDVKISSFSSPKRLAGLRTRQQTVARRREIDAVLRGEANDEQIHTKRKNPMIVSSSNYNGTLDE